MARRFAVVLFLLVPLLVAGSAWSASTSDRKRTIDVQIAQLRQKLEATNRQEAVLTEEISAVTAKIRVLEADVTVASSRVHALEAQLAESKNRLAALTHTFQLQTERLRLLRREHHVAEERLSERLVAIYQSDDPTPLEVVLSATSFSDLLDQLDYIRGIGEQDRRIARQVGSVKGQVHEARAQTQRTRVEVKKTTEEIEVRTEERRAERDKLVAAQQQLADVRAVKEQSLAVVQISKRDYLHEVAGLERASATLAARIQAAQQARAAAAAAAAAEAAARRSAGAASPSGAASEPVEVPVSTPSAAGMIWPVSGPVTSGFGWRWGRMHEGIDIGARTGTPIVSAAAGSVIFAGWMSGYGQIVVVDHGGGLATAYAHMSSMASSVGQSVAQGQVIGYVGCTGRCFGSHLHFEVRVNGRAVDPLRYL